MGKVFQLVILSVAIAALGQISSAQDLGSSNKLFGGTPSGKPTTAKGTSTKSKAKPKKAPPKTAVARKDSARKPAVKIRTGKDVPDQNAGVAPIPKNNPVDPAVEKAFNKLIADGNKARGEREYARAEAEYRRAVAYMPGDYRGHYGLGSIYADQLRWSAAETEYRKAQQINPNLAMTNIALSYVLAQPLVTSDIAGRYEEAEKFALKALSLEPRDALAFDRLGVARELRGLLDQTTENAYRRAIEESPDFAPAYAHLGRFLRRKGKMSESADAFEKAIKKAIYPASMIMVAKALQSDQRFADSVAVLKKVVAQDPKNPTALLLLGRGFTSVGAYTDAEVVLRKASMITPGGVSAWTGLAELYLRVKKPESAEDVLQRAARNADGPDKFELARLFEAVGDEFVRTGGRASAETAYRKAKELNPELASIAAKIARVKGKN